jgi:type IV secretion system protein TrbI
MGLVPNNFGTTARVFATLRGLLGKKVEARPRAPDDVGALDASPPGSDGRAALQTRSKTIRHIMVTVGFAGAAGFLVFVVSRPLVSGNAGNQQTAAETGVRPAKADVNGLEAAAGNAKPAAQPPRQVTQASGAQPAERQQVLTGPSGGQSAQPTDPYAAKRLAALERAIAAPIPAAVEPGSRNGAGGAPVALSRNEMIAEIARAKAAAQAATTGQSAASTYAQDMARLKALSQNGSPVLVAHPSSGNGGPPLPFVGGPANGGAAGLGQSATGSTDSWALNSTVQTPVSKYELRAGFVIPAVLVGGINSELPGQVVGQVSENVYDTATGRYLLIPQGARLVGTYSADVAYGQSRVLVSWQRIVFPDGRTLDIGAMPGADAAGYGGFKDQANNHYFRIFGSALLMSGITAGITYSQSRFANTSTNGTTNNVTVSGAMAQALGDQLGQVAGQMIQKNMSVAPTLTIRPGYEFNVVVTKDMTFKAPYRAFDY